MMDRFEYATQVMMPDKFHPDDGAWIRQMLLELRYTTRLKVALEYANVYQKIWESEPISFKKDNQARHEANTRLREFVRKYAAYSRGKVTTPEWLQDSTSQNKQATLTVPG
ncbi:hypothetical protein ACWWJF_20645 [Symbiopectobacterium sp. Eva_TO]